MCIKYVIHSIINNNGYENESTNEQQKNSLKEIRTITETPKKIYCIYVVAINTSTYSFSYVFTHYLRVSTFPNRCFFLYILSFYESEFSSISHILLRNK